MALDDVVRTTITGPRIEEAMYRTLRWIDRCIAGNCSGTHRNLMVFSLHPLFTEIVSSNTRQQNYIML